MPRRLTRDENIARIEWNIRDATEALHNAVSMRNWAGVRKYTAQIEKYERLLNKATSVGGKRHRRTWMLHSRFISKKYKGVP